MATIVLGVSSSISAYKACEVLRGFQKAGHDVQVIMTRNASELIRPQLFSALSGRRTIVGLFDEDRPWSVAHVALAREAALFVVAPATANVIAKLAWGVADDFLTTFALAVEAPVLVAPAMNEAMMAHPQTQDNIRRLRERGVDFVEPARGYLACGDEGWGRLAEPADIVAAGLAAIARSESLSGLTVVVTAGPTREPLDPVRYLTNRSSGRMGYAVAREALRRGARVVLVSGPTALVPPRGAEVETVTTAAEMAAAAEEAFSGADIAVLAAAVADFAFAAPSGQKIKKASLPPSLGILPTPDILKSLGEKKTAGQTLVGFAAETENVRVNARAKLRDKNLDLIVANDVSAEGLGFDSEMNKAVLIDAAGVEDETEVLSKAELAARIWDAIERIRGQKS
jgi:phosphopantothenoylcysteine decarboxylase/phosphopantothenate--cysteine ligase